MIRFSSVSRIVGTASILHDVNFTILPSECMCFLGKSGAGKTMLLRLLLKLETPTSGTIHIDDLELTALPEPLVQQYRKCVGAVFENTQVSDDIPCINFIEFPLRLLGLSRVDALNQAGDALEKVGLSHQSQNTCGDLTLQEKKALLLARALALKPSIVLLDCFFDGLDDQSITKLYAILERFQESGGTIILTTRQESVAKLPKMRCIQLCNGTIDTTIKPHLVTESAATEPQAATMHVYENPQHSPVHQKLKISIQSEDSDTATLHSSFGNSPVAFEQKEPPSPPRYRRKLPVRSRMNVAQPQPVRIEPPDLV